MKKGYAKQLPEEQLDMSNLQAALDDLLANQTSYYQAMQNSNEIKSVEDFYAFLKNDISKGKK